MFLAFFSVFMYPFRATVFVMFFLWVGGGSFMLRDVERVPLLFNFQQIFERQQKYT
jgi:hypothetical protein